MLELLAGRKTSHTRNLRSATDSSITERPRGDARYRLCRSALANYFFRDILPAQSELRPERTAKSKQRLPALQIKSRLITSPAWTG